MTTPNLPAWPTTQSVEAELEEAMDIHKLDNTEKRNIICMVLKAFRDGHIIGIESMGEAWSKSNKELFSSMRKEPTHDAA